MSAEQIHPSAAAELEQDDSEILSDAGVELSLHSLKASSDHSAPLELLAEVSLQMCIWVGSWVDLCVHTMN